MVVSTTNYGAYTTHEGTLADVMALLKGKSRNMFVALAYDVGNSKWALVVHGK